MPETTRAFLLQLWNDLDIQVMVLTSLMVQLFLLFTGNLRRRRVCGLLRGMIWLAYVGADAIAVWAIGLLSQYEGKFKLRSRQLSEDHTLPFLWAPFLLLHLGGQDTITAFSMEDNNLWSRHLLNLMVQVSLTLYAFWKAFDILDFQLLAIAVPIFVAGLIKYGERTWALYSGSREYLNSPGEVQVDILRDYRSTDCGDVASVYALNTVLRVRALFTGRTLDELPTHIKYELVKDFQEQREGNKKEVKEMLKIVMVELGMLYDLLYTKAMVLQSRTGCIFRCIADTSMVVAFVLFLVNDQLHAYNRADYIITCTLFAGALFMEACSVLMVLVSPWTRACLKKGTFLLWLSCSASFVFNAIVQRKTRNVQQEMPTLSMGQFNVADYSISQIRRPKFISKVVHALGLWKQERNILYMKHIMDNGISAYIGSLYSCGEGLQELQLCEALLYELNLPFDVALFNLHLYTDLYLSSLELQGDEMVVLAAECMTLTNYMMYLLFNCPYMLPVSGAAQDLEPAFQYWVRIHGKNWNTGNMLTKRKILELYGESTVSRIFTLLPFASLPPSMESLMTIKETWARLLIYAAGKCPMETHTRQLSNGVEPITFLSFLMLQHAEGDAGLHEVRLFTLSNEIDEPVEAEQSTVSVGGRVGRPRYAFCFCEHTPQQSEEITMFSVAPWTPSLLREYNFRGYRRVSSGRTWRLERRKQRQVEILKRNREQDKRGTCDTSNSEESEMEQQQAHAALEDDTSSETSVESEVQQQAHATLEDTLPETDAASEILQNQAHVVVAIDAPLAPEIDQVVDAPLNTEEAGYVTLEIQHKGEPADLGSIGLHEKHD